MPEAEFKSARLPTEKFYSELFTVFSAGPRRDPEDANCYLDFFGSYSCLFMYCRLRFLICIIRLDVSGPPKIEP